MFAVQTMNRWLKKYWVLHQMITPPKITNRYQNWWALRKMYLRLQIMAPLWASTPPKTNVSAGKLMIERQSVAFWIGPNFRGQVVRFPGVKKGVILVFAYSANYWGSSAEVMNRTRFQKKTHQQYPGTFLMDGNGDFPTHFSMVKIWWKSSNWNNHFNSWKFQVPGWWRSGGNHQTRFANFYIAFLVDVFLRL